MTTSELVDRLAANWELEPVETRKVCSRTKYVRPISPGKRLFYSWPGDFSDDYNRKTAHIR